MSGRRRARRLVAAVSLLLAAACGSERYAWGPYEESVLNTLHDFRDEDLLAELARLEEHEARLRQEDKLPPPGLHAQLGYLHFLAGNGDATVRHFEAEKTVYPESTVFIDGMLERVK